MCKETLHGLAYLHSMGKMHRDIKVSCSAHPNISITAVVRIEQSSDNLTLYCIPLCCISSICNCQSIADVLLVADLLSTLQCTLFWGHHQKVWFFNTPVVILHFQKYVKFCCYVWYICNINVKLPNSRVIKAVLPSCLFWNKPSGHVSVFVLYIAIFKNKFYKIVNKCMHGCVYVVRWGPGREGMRQSEYKYGFWFYMLFCVISFDNN
jgi:serine/threonine protein kinase